jgi:hypothetical protein
MIPMTMIEKVRRMFRRQNKSIREIARLTSLSRNTIHKYLHADIQEEPKYRRKAKPTQLAPFHETLTHALAVDARLRRRKGAPRGFCSRRSRRPATPAVIRGWRRRRVPTRRAMTVCARLGRLAMRDLTAELKQLRLHGMAAAWGELLEQGNVEESMSRWLLEQLLTAESADRAVRSVNHQMGAAKFPVRRDLAGFDFDGSPVECMRSRSPRSQARRLMTSFMTSSRSVLARR